MKRILTYSIMLLLLFLNVSSANEIYLEKQIKQPISIGNTLYVGGSGPGNYTKIQYAIDNASDGDTVFVYDDSSPYNEYDIKINKSINLIGENRDTTIIDGEGSFNSLLTINADNCLIRGLNFQNIRLNAINLKNSLACEITNNIFNCSDGIQLIRSSYCIISDNLFYSSESIYLIDNCNYTVIRGNIFYLGGHFGAIFSDFNSGYNNVSNNLFNQCRVGIILADIQNWNITHNTFKRNTIGILLSFSSNNLISKNNFQFNKINAMFLYKESKNIWISNYWNRSRLLPKIIFGFELVGEYHLAPIPIMNLHNIDWHPAQEPYDI